MPTCPKGHQSDGDRLLRRVRRPDRAAPRRRVHLGARAPLLAAARRAPAAHLAGRRPAG